MLVTLFGTFILSIAEQPENALPLIVVILFGIDKPTSSLHPKTYCREYCLYSLTMLRFGVRHIR